jgi:hypothetical protein
MIMQNPSVQRLEEERMKAEEEKMQLLVLFNRGPKNSYRLKSKSAF